MAVTIVALFIGLPASGKSTLAKWLVSNCGDEETSVDHIEYDQVEDGLLLEAQQDSSSKDDDSSSHAREIWKQSRQKSLELFQDHLRESSNHNSKKKRIIFMDDNFHLRSMRREIYRICQEYVQEHDKAKVHFCLLCVDTPVELCLERNQHRQRPVPEDVITRMSATLELPGRDTFEHCFFQIRPSTKSSLIQNFITQQCIKDYEPVPPPPPPIDLEQLEEERRKTRESWLHGWDQRLRKWVGGVAQISRRDTGKANKARKSLLTRLRQEEQQREELPTEATIVERFLNEMEVEWTKAQKEQFYTATRNENSL